MRSSSSVHSSRSRSPSHPGSRSSAPSDSAVTGPRAEVEQALVPAPALPHPHLEVEEDAGAELALELRACGGADLLDLARRRVRSGSPSGTRSRPRSGRLTSVSSVLALLDVGDLRPRPRAAAPRACGAAPARGSARRAGPRWAGPSAARAGRGSGPPGPARPARSISGSRPVAAAGADRKDLVDALELGGGREHGGGLGVVEPVDLVDGADDRGARRSPSSSALAMKRSPGPTPCSPLTTNRTTSESASSRSTRRCMRSVRTSRGRCTPGRSVRTSCQPAATSVATPRIARRVVCGRSETIATLAPTIALTRVDLPAFGRPATPTKPERVGRSLKRRPRGRPAGRP